MDKFKAVTIVLLLANSSSVFAGDIIFMPIDNKPLVKTNVKVGGLSYGLSDEEIAKRVEMGLTETVPISALKKWQEKRKQKNTEIVNMQNSTQNLPTTQNSISYSGTSNAFIDVNTDTKNKIELYIPSNYTIVDNQSNLTPNNKVDNQNSQNNGVINHSVTPSVETNTDVLNKN